MSEKEEIKRYKEMEGSVSVNGDITPVTRRPIPQINANEWANMGYDELFRQHSDLKKRMLTVRTMGRPDLEKTMARGLAQLEQLMQEKHSDDEVKLL